MYAPQTDGAVLPTGVVKEGAAPLPFIPISVFRTTTEAPILPIPDMWERHAARRR